VGEPLVLGAAVEEGRRVDVILQAGFGGVFEAVGDVVAVEIADVPADEGDPAASFAEGEVQVECERRRTVGGAASRIATLSSSGHPEHRQLQRAESVRNS